MGQHVDFLIVGGGIAGVAVGAELALHGSVLLIEREGSLSYHTTGRSAAISMEGYGNALIRQFTRASRHFYENPPPELTTDALCAPRGALIVSDEIRRVDLKKRYEAVAKEVPAVQWLDRKAVAEIAPFLGEQWIAGIYEPNAFDLDVHAIHSAFVRGIRLRGGMIRTKAEISHAERRGSIWDVTLMTDDTVRAKVIINAAGAWADVVAERCHATRLGIQPLLRTVVVVDPERDVSHCPYIGTVDEQLFIKPDAGRLLVSPCDEVPSAPCDALPSELGIAIAMDRLHYATALRPQRVINRWAGLRSFVPDRSPLIGPDPSQESFIWYAALGGYGIQTAPAMARLCASLAIGHTIPRDLGNISSDDVAPLRMISESPAELISVAKLN